jgi:electron transfer flavoprotein alpha subunit
MLAQAQAEEKTAERVATKVAMKVATKVTMEVATMVLSTPKALWPEGTMADEAVRTAERKRKTAAVMTARMTAMAI